MSISKESAIRSPAILLRDLRPHATWLFGATAAALLLVGAACNPGAALPPATSTPQLSATAVPATATPEPTATKPPTPTGVSPSDPFLVPVSKTRSIPADYVPPDLTAITSVQTAVNGLQVRSIVLVQLKTMLDEASVQGYSILPVSTYRSYQQQATLYQNYVAQYGEAEADRFSARPGHSEHQLGTAIDFTSAKVSYDLLESFGALPEGRWLLGNAHRFGFVLSYPEGKEPVTGYAYEPWHYRYVGVDVAAAIQKSGLTPVEYLAKASR